jgi:leucyl-tRNA---protein transferase
MMNDPHYILPDKSGCKGTVLDAYLSYGYYRMYHMIFTTNQTALDMDSESLPVFWLRTEVLNVVENKVSAAIRKKCAAFSVTYKKAAITPEIEALYQLYHSQVNFITSATCKDCITDDSIQNPFDTSMIEIRDGSTLIAVGYFDLGKTAIAGILNFYHPGYKKYSLGKYLMLQKIEYALLHKITYYYTGYISTASGKFDYKLFPDVAAIQVFLPIEKVWLPYATLGKMKLAEYYAAHFIN